VKIKVLVQKALAHLVEDHVIEPTYLLDVFIYHCGANVVYRKSCETFFRSAIKLLMVSIRQMGLSKREGLAYIEMNKALKVN